MSAPNKRGRAIPPATRSQSKAKGKKKGGKGRGKRWYLGVENASLGPFSIKNFGIGSGDKPGRSMDNPVRTNEAVPGMQNTAIHTRRERLGEISGTTTFAVTVYAINPGNPALFPWASQIAPLYEKYMIRDMRFVFVQTGSGYAPANVSGRVVLGCDYDVMSPDIASIQEAENKNPNVGFAPYESAVLRLDPRMMNTEPKYTRGVNYPPGGDPKMYDGGKLFVAVGGTPNTSVLGVVYVEYDLEFFTPQLAQTIAFTPNYHLASFDVGPASISGASATTNTVLTRSGAQNAGGLVMSLLTTNSFNLRPGTWQISGNLAVQGAGAVLGTVKLTMRINGGSPIILWERAGPGSSTEYVLGFKRYVMSTVATDVYSLEWYGVTGNSSAITVLAGDSRIYFEY